VFVLICTADKAHEESLKKTIEVDRLIDMASDANPREGEKYKDQGPSASNLFECLYRKKRNDTPYVHIVIAC